jgi:hypothetical protein
MRKVQFTNGNDPRVTEVLSPFTGQFALVHRARANSSTWPITLFPGLGDRLMRVPESGYLLETVAYGVCAAAAFSVVVMLLLTVG